MGKVFFISGIDTDVGKTVVTGLMARALHKSGVRVITVKMVQTGNIGYSEDLQRHRALMGVAAFPEDSMGLTAPQIFAFPSSPHLAARLEGKKVDLRRIEACVRTLAERYELVLVEGAGGLAVPLTEHLLTVDFVAAQGWELILVSSGKLGSLNHTLLSIEAAVTRGIKVRGVAYNFCSCADPVIDEESPRMIQLALRQAGQRDTLVRFPYMKGDAIPDCDCSALFGEYYES